MSNNAVPHKKQVDISINPRLFLPIAAKLTEPIKEPTPIIPDIIPSSTGPFSYTVTMYAGKSILKGIENATKEIPISINKRTNLFEYTYLNPSTKSRQNLFSAPDFCSLGSSNLISWVHAKELKLSITTVQ